jgi:hypothetical protein
MPAIGGAATPLKGQRRSGSNGATLRQVHYCHSRKNGNPYSMWDFVWRAMDPRFREDDSTLFP